MSVKTYAPKDVQMIVGGNIMSGFGDGTFITASREDDAYTKHTGVDGETGRAKSNNRSGELTIFLSQYSASNDVLSALALADELSDSGIVPIILKDSRGTTTVFSGEGWVRKKPDVEYAKEFTDREWIFDMASMEYTIGGIT